MSIGEKIDITSDIEREILKIFWKFLGAQKRQF